MCDETKATKRKQNDMVNVDCLWMYKLVCECMIMRSTSKRADGRGMLFIRDLEHTHTHNDSENSAIDKCFNGLMRAATKKCQIKAVVGGYREL